MRMLSTVAALLAVATLCSGDTLAADRNWIVQAGGGSATPSQQSGLESGSGAFIAVLHEARPWLAVGAEAHWLGWAAGGLVTFPENRVWANRTNAGSIAATCRLQAPVRAGLAPFAVVEAGYARLRSGDLFYDGSAFGLPSGVEPGEVQWGTRMGIGAGLRVVIPRGWPDPEASVRSVTLGLDRQTSFTDIRFALSW